MKKYAFTIVGFLIGLVFSPVIAVIIAPGNIGFDDLPTPATFAHFFTMIVSAQATFAQFFMMIASALLMGLIGFLIDRRRQNITVTQSAANDRPIDVGEVGPHGNPLIRWTLFGAGFGLLLVILPYFGLGMLSSTISAPFHIIFSAVGVVIFIIVYTLRIYGMGEVIIMLSVPIIAFALIGLLIGFFIKTKKSA